MESGQLLSHQEQLQDPAAGTSWSISHPGHSVVHHAASAPSTAVTKYRRLAGDKQQKLPSHGAGGWEFQVRVPAWSGSGEQPRQTSSHCILTSGREELAQGSFISKGTDPI